MIKMTDWSWLFHWNYIKDKDDLRKYGKRLCIWVIIGIVMTAVLSHRNRFELDSIAVSEDEQYIAFVHREWNSESRGKQMLVCYRQDGSFVFEADVTPITAGGICAVRFEGDEIHAASYREEITQRFSLDGAALGIAASDIQVPEQFPGFSWGINKRTYHGKQFYLVYRYCTILGLRFFPEKWMLVLNTDGGQEVCLWRCAGADSYDKGVHAAPVS